MARPPPLQELPPGYTPPARAASPQIPAGSLKSPLWLRAYFQGLLFSLGCGIQRHCGKVLFLGLLAFGALALGLRVAIVETDLEQLWVEVGSRVSQELHYTKEKLGEEAAYTSQMLIQTPRQEGENVLTPEALGLHLQAALTASKVQVSLYGKSWDLNKICYKSGIPLIENGMIERMIEKLFPCVILTPLDCFWEGAKLQGGSAYLPGRPDIQWTNLDPEQLLEELGPFASLEGFRELLDKAQVGQAYVGRPCLHPDDLHCPPSAPNHHSKQAPNVAQELSGGCHGFSHKFMHWQEELLLGGMARDPQGQLLRAEALQSTFLLMSPRQLYEHFRGDYQTHDIGWSEEQAGTVLQAWQRRFVQVSVQMGEGGARGCSLLLPLRSTLSLQLAQEALPQNSSQQIHAFSSTTLDDILHAFSEVSAARVVGGYLLMLAYACVTMLRWDCAQSQGAVGLAGVLLVALAVASGLGLCALLGIAFNAATTQVLPFLALGIGVDDIFLLAHAFTEAPPGTPLQERTGECLQRTGTSVALTSISHMVAFFMAALVPIPALRAFSLQAAIVVGCNFAAVMLVFPAVLSLDLHRRHCQRLDVLCCFSSPCSARVIQILPQELGDGTVPVGIAHLTATVQAFAHCEAGSQHVVTILPPRARLVPPPSDPLGSELFSPGGSTRDLLGQEEGTRQKATCSSLPCARWNLAHFARSQFAPLLLQSHSKAIVLVLFGALLGLSLYGATLVQDGLALTDVVPRGTKEHAFLSAQLSASALSRPCCPHLPPRHRAPGYTITGTGSWVRGIQAAFDQDWASGRISRHSCRNGSEDGALAYKLLIQTGDTQEPLDFSQLTTRKLVDKEGLIAPELFYVGLTMWVSSDPLGLAASQANFYPPPPEWLHDKYDTTGENLRIPAAQPLEFAQFPFLLRGLQKTADFVEAIEGARAACAEAGRAGVRAYPSGSPFLFWEQYLGLRRYFLLAICILLVCTFLVCALLLLNPWTAGLIVLVLAMMTVELFGIMGFLGIKLSAIPVVILVASVGIGVEFTVHVALGFLTTQGSRNLRAAHALERTFAPVTDGAVSTLLGLLMLAGSNFDFIIRYFFVVLTVLTLLGLLHGLVLLPVLLSILGPPPEVVQMYKESPEVLSPQAPREGGLRWGLPPTLPQSFARVTTSMTVALHPPPLPGAYIHPASDEPTWSPVATPAANGSSNLSSRGPCPATG
uniref:protein patched homolog 2 isoform X5 n=1 Tax=Nyctereutes procyonoides TaxID=34880 RepID=UPI002444F85F|nr:protein patched homolog 2 isoform X5 [Nyctereutes procyonoides]